MQCVSKQTEHTDTNAQAYTETLVLLFLEDIVLGYILCLETYSILKHTCMTSTEPQRFYASETGTENRTLAHGTDSVQFISTSSFLKMNPLPGVIKPVIH